MIRLQTILTLIFLTLLTGCSEKITVLTKICNIDSDEKDLILHFDFKRMYTTEDAFVTKISIFRGDSLICKLQSWETKEISRWDYPSIPEGFKVLYSEDQDKKLPILYKNQELRFEFSGGVNKYAFGTWTYKPNYADKDSRSLFDEAGFQKNNINCYFQPSIGKNVVWIESTEKFNISDTTFSLKNLEGQPINFTTKYKRNPANKVGLIIKDLIETGTKLVVSFDFGENLRYNDIITVQ